VSDRAIDIAARKLAKRIQAKMWDEAKAQVETCMEVCRTEFADTWHPIGTAPRIDEWTHTFRLDLWVVGPAGDGFRATDCWWESGEDGNTEMWVEGFGQYYADKVMLDWMDYRATHWRPIPAPPEGAR
jgi:hypothetical protein